ncbi:MAG: hypothetical protein ABSD20_12740 [Terriglobales bacterium]|jgi:hypothetical protein
MRITSVCVLLTLALIAALFAFAQQPISPGASAANTAANGPSSADMQAMAGMDIAHVHEMPHMKLTPLREAQPGDHVRADNIVATLHDALPKYRDYRVAERDGYHIFMPKLPQKMYHFTKYEYTLEAATEFNPAHPTSLLYEKSGDSFKLIGAMYTMPFRATLDELNDRVPLSVTRWHLHTDFCAAPKGEESEYLAPHPRFGLRGSITTMEACTQAGGQFHDHIFGWMVHVYPFEKNWADIWSLGRQMDHEP